MLKESPAGPPIDRSQRHGSPVLLLLVTLVVVGSVLSLAVLDEQHHATVLTLFLASFAALGVLAAFLYAVGILQFAGRASRNDITKAIVDGARMASSCSIARARFSTPMAPTRISAVACPAVQPASVPSSACSPVGSDVSEAVYRLAQAAREGRGATETIRLVPALTGGGSYGWYRVRVRPLSRAEATPPCIGA